VSFDGIVIDVFPAVNKHPLQIHLDYPEFLELFKGDDLRSDAIFVIIKSVRKVKISVYCHQRLQRE